jgi:hypothetical protein
MRRLVLFLCIIFNIFVPQGYMITTDNYTIFNSWRKDKPEEITKLMTKDLVERNITSMEALDRVKELYAANFEKADTKDTSEEYYYKLPFADYYLVYEGAGESENEYVFHLYEFVTDEPTTGIGHTVTYGWYKVNKESGLVTDQTQ